MLKEQLGKKPRFNDDQRRSLATKAKKIGLQRLNEIAAFVTPHTLLGWHQRLIQQIRWQRQALSGPTVHAGGSVTPLHQAQRG